MEDVRRQEVRQLARLVARLDPTQQMFFQAEYGRHRRNPTTAFLLCLLLGDFGAHYFYFGRYRAGVVRLLFCWTLIPGILALFDARTMVARTRRYNASLAHEVVLAISGTVDEQAQEAPAVVEAAERAPVASGRRPVLAAPISTPAMEAVAAAAWAGREPSADDGHHHAEYHAYHDVTEASGAHWPNAMARPVQPVHDGYDDLYAEPYSAAGDGQQHDAPAWPASDEVGLGAGEGMSASAESSWGAEYADESVHGDVTAASAAVAGAAALYAATSHEPVDQIPLESSLGRWDAADELPTLGAKDGEPMSAADAREPVLMYQVAAMPRRESVRLAPLPADYRHEDDVGGADANHATAPHTDYAGPPAPLDMAGRKRDDASKQGHGANTEVALAALGSALAAGLADLLREHPRTRPLTRPRAPATLPLNADASATVPEPAASEADAPAAMAPVDPNAAAATYGTFADEADYPATPTADEAPAWPLEDEALAKGSYQGDWGQQERGAADAFATPYAPEAPHIEERPDTHWDAGAAMEGAAIAGGTAAGLYAGWDAQERLRPRETSPLATASETAAMAPALEHTVVPAPLPSLRRRVVQRVIVRKMAVLDGEVVAEATVERQVPVVADEEEMAARIRMATRDAAREALGYLLMQAPEEARPSIREQIQALQGPTA